MSTTLGEKPQSEFTELPISDSDFRAVLMTGMATKSLRDRGMFAVICIFGGRGKSSYRKYAVKIMGAVREDDLLVARVVYYPGARTWSLISNTGQEVPVDSIEWPLSSTPSARATIAAGAIMRDICA